MKKTHYAERLMPPVVSRTGTACLVVFIVVPVLYLLALALSPNSTVALGGTDFRHFTGANFTGMWSAAAVARGMLNSLIIAGTAAALAVVLGVCAGIQGILGVHLIGSYPAIIAVYMTFGLPLATVVCFVYLRGMPADLEEAALVDGCTRFGALRRVVAPLMAPAMVVSLMFAFLVGWNDVLFASALQNQTIAVTLEQFGLAQSEGFGAQPLYGDLMAAALVSAIPVVVLYLAFQRYLVHGLAAGALSGT